MAIARGEYTITELYDGDNFYRAWADTPDGSGDSFSITESGRLYIGTYVGLTRPSSPSQYTWSKIVGESAVIGALSNDTHQIGTDQDGEEGNYHGANTTLTIFRGGIEETDDWNITLNIQPENSVEGTFSDHTYTVTKLKTDEATITFTAEHKTRKNDSLITKVFSLSKNKQGIDGKDAKSYFLNFNDTSIKKNRVTNEIFPENLVIEGYSITGEADPVPTSGYFKVFTQSEISVGRDEYEQAYINELLDPEEYYVLSENNYPLILAYESKEAEDELIYGVTQLIELMSVKVYWYKDPEFKHLLDVQTVLISSDGIDGVSITGFEEHYKRTNSDTIPDIDDSWDDKPVNPTKDLQYLWNYETVRYSDGNETTTEPRIMTMYVKDGSSITNIEELYAVTKDPVQPADDTFTKGVKVTDSTNRYLWNKQIITITHDDGTTKPEISYAIIGTHGLTGESGRTVSLTTPELAFVYDEKTSTRNAQTITWTATAYNTSGTVYYEFLVNGSSQVNSTKNSYGQAVPVDFTYMPVTVTVNIREGSKSGKIVATDHQTIFGVKAGYTPIKGVDYIDGKDKYVWIMFADDDQGNGITSNPEGKRYQGVAYNKDTPTPSTTKSDYKWLALYDNVIVGGRNLFPHSGNFRGRPLSFWWDNGGGLIYNDTERYNGFGTLETNVGAGIHGQWMTLENNVEYMYSVTLKSEDTFSGSFIVPLHYHAGKDNVHRNKIQVLDGDISYTENDLGQFKRLWIRFKLTGDANSFRPFIYWGGGTPRKFFIANLQLERGNILTDWTLAPEDWEYQLEIISKDTLENTKQQAELEKTRADKIYNHLINVKDKDGKNTVTGTVRTNLINAKNNLNNHHNTLLVRINNTLKKDGPVSETDKQQINTAYNSFMIAIADFDLRAQEAGSDRMNIVDKRVTEVENYSTADSIIQRVTTTETYLDGKENPLNKLAEWKTAAEIKMRDDNIVLAVRESSEYQNDLDPETIVSSINMSSKKIKFSSEVLDFEGAININSLDEDLLEGYRSTINTSMEDKTEALSGVEIFTDKSDDSLVHVEVDGKNYQHAGNGKNLFNKDHIRNAYFSNTTGSISNGGDSHISGFIYVRNNVTYIASKSLEKVGFYDNNKKFIERLGETNTFKVPNDASFVILQWKTDSIDLDTFQLEEGSTATSYELPTPTPEYPIEIYGLDNFDVVSSVGKENLIKNVNERPSSMTGSGSTSPTVKLVDMKTPFGDEAFEITFPANNQTGYSGSRAVTNSLTMYGGKRYSYHTYVYYPDGKASGVRIYPTGRAGMAFLNADTSKDIGEWKYYGHENHLLSLNFKTANNYMTYYANDVFSSPKTIYVSVVKFEEGEETTPYSPRPEDIPESDNHPLIDKISLSLSEPLRSVGDVKDKLFRDSDGLWKVERNVKEISINGNYRWYFHGVKSNQRYDSYEAVVSGANFSNNSEFKTSNQFAYNEDQSDFSFWTGGTGGVYINFSVPKNYFENTDVLVHANTSNVVKTHFNNNPLIVYYSVPPIIEILDQELQDKLNDLRSFKDSNYVYTVINGKTNVISENLKPTLHATFKGGGYYTRHLARKDNGTIRRLITIQEDTTHNDFDPSYYKDNYMDLTVSEQKTALTIAIPDILQDDEGILTTRATSSIVEQSFLLDGVTYTRRGYVSSNTWNEWKDLSSDIVKVDKKYDEMHKRYLDDKFADSDTVAKLDSDLQANVAFWRNTFTLSGGVNELRNSVGYAGLEFWDGSSQPPLIEMVQDAELEVYGSGSGFILNSYSSGVTTLKQTVHSESGPKYFSALVNNFRGTASIEIKHDGTNQVINMPSSNNNEYVLYEKEFTLTGTEYEVIITSAHRGQMKITNIMVNPGTERQAWGFAHDEVYGSTFNMNRNGLRVYREGTDKMEYTAMTPDEFAGYAEVGGRSTKVFALNGETTIMKRANVQEEIRIGNISMIKVNAGDIQGLAFIRSGD